MPTGSELLKQLQQRRAQPAAVTSAPKIASPKVPTVAAITASVEDEWITDESGRRRRVRAAGHAMPGSTFDRTMSAVGSLDSDEALNVAQNIEGMFRRANAAADELAVASLEPHHDSQDPAEADAEGWNIVRQHDSEYDCWIVIGGRVLDATAYLGHHPGGSTIIKRLAGRDATKAYERAYHSRAADLKLHDFDIGALSDVKRLSRAARQAQEVRKRLEAAAAYLD